MGKDEVKRGKERGDGNVSAIVCVRALKGLRGGEVRWRSHAGWREEAGEGMRVRSAVRMESWASARQREV